MFFVALFYDKINFTGEKLGGQNHLINLSSMKKILRFLLNNYHWGPIHAKLDKRYLSSIGKLLINKNNGFCS